MTSILLGCQPPSFQHLEESAPYNVQSLPTSHLEGAGCSNLYVEFTSHSTKSPLPVACHLLSNSGKMGFRGSKNHISISFNPEGALCTPSSGQILRQS